METLAISRFKATCLAVFGLLLSTAHAQRVLQEPGRHGFGVPGDRSSSSVRQARRRDPAAVNFAEARRLPWLHEGHRPHSRQRNIVAPAVSIREWEVLGK